MELPIYDAFHMGMEAIQTIYPTADKPNDYRPTNAEILIQILADVVSNGADEDGFPNIAYEELIGLTAFISCPYVHNEKCAIDEKKKNNPDAFQDCDACKAHWLMEKWED